MTHLSLTKHPLLLLLVGAAVLFAFGLPGGFILDDFANLAALTRVKESAGLSLFYVFEGITGFPGRPLSYLSFLLQYDSWPDRPADFKAVNIAVHLACGAFIWLIVTQLAKLLGRRDGTTLALVTTAIWLFHPIQVSTVLYVVQRMTQLSALLSLAAVAAYLHGRQLALAGRTVPAYVWMTSAVALGTPLAILGKENGVLLPVYIAAIEFTLLSCVARPKWWSRWAALFVALPPALLAAYLAWTAHSWLTDYATRRFDLVSRLYTEAVVLWDYVGKIIFPRPRAFGLYFDDYAVAAAPWESLGTALAVFAWLALAALALAVRRRYSVPAFAVFWYLGGHALESTVLPLELYFEHRNYLPLLGAAFALAWGIMRLWERASSVASRRTYAAVAVLAATTFGAITFLELRTWADPVRQAAVWASERPHSTRAQYALGTLYLTHRQYGEAQRVFLAAEKAQPKEVQFILARAYIGCFVQDQWKPDWPEVVMRLQSGNISPLVYEFLTGMTDQLEEKQCRSLSPQIVRDLVDAVLANPRAKLSAYQWAGWYIKGRTYALEGQLDPAIRALEAADAVQPNLGVLHDQVTWLASAGLHDQALRFIERSRKDSRWRLSQRLHYDNIFDAWERDLREAGRLGRP